MKKIKKENGAISVIVVVTILFILTILSAMYGITSIVRQSQLKSQIHSKAIYQGQLTNATEIYDELIAKAQNVNVIGDYKVYTTDEGELVQGEIYDDIAVTIIIKNMDEIDTIDSVTMNDQEENVINEEENIIGDEDGKAASFIISENGLYIATIISTTDGIQTTSTININITQISARAGLKVGDYIDYTPDTASPYTTLTAANTGSSSNSTSISQDSLKWQILKINKDGSMDLIGSPTTKSIDFYGATGYNNGVNIMNDICKSLYSKGSITARSVNLEDIEYWLTDVAKTTRNGYSSYSGGPTYGHTQTYITNRYYPNLYFKELGAKIDSGLADLTEGIDKESVNTTGLELSKEGNETGSTKAGTSLTVTQTYYYLSSIDSTNFGDGAKALYNDNGTNFWVASRCADCGSSRASFGLRRAGSYLVGYDVFRSNNNTYYGDCRLRPVVSLGSNVQITASLTASTDSSTPHSITQY